MLNIGDQLVGEVALDTLDAGHAKAGAISAAEAVAVQAVTVPIETVAVAMAVEDKPAHGSSSSEDQDDKSCGHLHLGGTGEKNWK